MHCHVSISMFANRLTSNKSLGEFKRRKMGFSDFLWRYVLLVWIVFCLTGEEDSIALIICDWWCLWYFRTMQTAVGVFGGEGYKEMTDILPLMVANAGNSNRPAISSLNCPPIVAVELCREHLVGHFTIGTTLFLLASHHPLEFYIMLVCYYWWFNLEVQFFLWPKETKKFNSFSLGGFCVCVCVYI